MGTNGMDSPPVEILTHDSAEEVAEDAAHRGAGSIAAEGVVLCFA